MTLLGLGGIGTVAATAGLGRVEGPADGLAGQDAAPRKVQGYQDSAHVRKYYRTAKI